MADVGKMYQVRYQDPQVTGAVHAGQIVLVQEAVSSDVVRGLTVPGNESVLVNTNYLKAEVLSADPNAPVS